MRAIRGRDIAMIFQEPMTSPRPVHTIGQQIGEAMRLHRRVIARPRRAIARSSCCEQVRHSPTAAERWTAIRSNSRGGMRQRAMIAMALACEPKLLIADEPTTALDVTTQAEILRLIRRAAGANGMAVLFITHDMGVVAEIADEVLVMHLGRIVERGPVDAIFHDPPAPLHAPPAGVGAEAGASRASRDRAGRRP